MSVDRRRQIIDVNHSQLSLVRQCELVSIARSSYYYRPKNESEFNLELMRLIDAQYLKTPWYGSRQMRRHLRRQGYRVNRKRIGRLMRNMGLVAVAPAPNSGLALLVSVLVVPSGLVLAQDVRCEIRRARRDHYYRHSHFKPKCLCGKPGYVDW